MDIRERIHCSSLNYLHYVTLLSLIIPVMIVWCCSCPKRNKTVQLCTLLPLKLNCSAITPLSFSLYWVYLLLREQIVETVTFYALPLFEYKYSKCDFLVFVQFHSENTDYFVRSDNSYLSFMMVVYEKFYFTFFKSVRKTCLMTRRETNEFLQGSSWVIY